MRTVACIDPRRVFKMPCENVKEGARVAKIPECDPN